MSGPSPAGAQGASASQESPMSAGRSAGLVRSSLAWAPRAWDILSIVGGIVLASLWYSYTGVRGGEDSADWPTCIALAGMPTGFVLFRRWTDKLLRPLEPVLGLMPEMARLFLGLAMPLFVSDYVYYTQRYRETDYIVRAVVGSVVASYIVLWRPAPEARPTTTAPIS